MGDVGEVLRGTATSPLYWACWGGSTDILQRLVDAGAGSREEKDGPVWVGSFVCAASIGNVEVVRLLIQLGVDVDGLDVWGETALILAAQCDHIDVIPVLLDEGNADINKTGTEGDTPLIRACCWGNDYVVRVLMEAGADPGIANEAGDTVMDVARHSERTAIIEILESWQR